MTSSPRSDGDPGGQTRVRRQEVVAELGQQALERADLEQLLDDATVGGSGSTPNRAKERRSRLRFLRLTPDRSGAELPTSGYSSSTIPVDG